MAYKRILLKLSGEALMGERNYGIDPKRLAEYAQDIKEIADLPKEEEDIDDDAEDDEPPSN